MSTKYLCDLCHSEITTGRHEILFTCVKASNPNKGQIFYVVVAPTTSAGKHSNDMLCEECMVRIVTDRKRAL